MDIQNGAEVPTYACQCGLNTCVMLYGTEAAFDSYRPHTLASMEDTTWLGVIGIAPPMLNC